MQHNEQLPKDNEQHPEENTPAVQPDLHAETDGRNKEWEDRARVNLEIVPEGTQTNLERDYEPEQEKTDGQKGHAAY